MGVLPACQSLQMEVDETSSSSEEISKEEELSQKKAAGFS